MKREEFTIILAQLQERDKKALEKLYVEYFSKIYSVALYELKNKDDAYDITMSVIMKICDYRGDPKEIENPTGFIITITYNTIKDYFRRMKWRSDTDIQTIEKTTEFRDTLWINDIMQLLTEDEKSVFIDHVIWERTLKVIAQERGMTYISLKRKYAKIKDKIKGLYK